MTEYTSDDNDDDLPTFHPGTGYRQPREPASPQEADTASVASC